MEYITADVAFLAMLGSAIWTSILLAQRSLHSRRAALARATATEGLLCAAIWLITIALVAHSFTSAAVTQSLWVGLIWGGFGFVARLPFQQRAAVTR
jgi:hypothetical protein